MAGTSSDGLQDCSGSEPIGGVCGDGTASKRARMDEPEGILASMDGKYG